MALCFRIQEEANIGRDLLPLQSFQYNETVSFDHPLNVPLFNANHIAANAESALLTLLECTVSWLIFVYCYHSCLTCLVQFDVRFSRLLSAQAVSLLRMN